MSKPASLSRIVQTMALDFGLLCTFWVAVVVYDGGMGAKIPAVVLIISAWSCLVVGLGWWAATVIQRRLVQ